LQLAEDQQEYECLKDEFGAADQPL
jgi:hypothetical protein